MSNQKYYIVSAEALPEVFVKVAEARRMLQVGLRHRGRGGPDGGHQPQRLLQV